MYQGKKHIVVPVVMMVEGVHNGSAGPLFHPISELGKIPASWNGIPVTIQHPAINGCFISANTPEILDDQAVGQVFNTFVDGNKLCSEVWLDEEKTAKISSEALEYIMKGKPLEVSVGVFSENDGVEGVWNGEKYVSSTFNHRPDHLALLPGGVGACSWSDGCGIRANSKGKEMDMTNLTRALRTLVGSEYFVIHKPIESGYQQLMDLMTKTLKEKYAKSGVWVYVIDLYDDYFIIEEYTEYDNITRYFKQGYTYDEEENTLTFIGTRVEVVRKIAYEELKIQNNSVPDFIRTKGVKNMDKKKECGCPDKINTLISNGAFSEDDREWLGTVDNEKLDKFIALSEKTEKKEEESKAPTVNNADEAIKVLREKITTPEQFIELLPEEMKDQMKNGLVLHRAQRKALVESIIGYSKAFTHEELETMGMDQLKKLSSLIPTQSDYSVMGNSGNVKINASDMLLPPGVEEEKK